ncbi:uroporphyrinogen-III synthase [Kocuria sp.]|uniref:uroporphyrinogen-III synthase n=1 Tax=Kocuria sp. TaxID=1871328 RepID=UPI0026DC8C24|nr:uroporphyrinogen-III synthase [Kocuria sp.]MDO4918884.1 uroporphyrinogen-III synthase [Kocuria sp.]
MSAPRVLVTRDPASARPLAELLRDRGWEPWAAPLLEAQLPADTEPLRALLREAAHPTAPTWLCVTSATTVAALAAVAGTADWGPALEAARHGAPGHDDAAVPPSVRSGPGVPGPAPRLRVAAVGTATTRALAAYGVGVDFVPTATSSAAGMLAEWPEEPGTHRGATAPRALLPASALASGTLADGLTAAGCRVARAIAYEMVPVPAERPLTEDRADHGLRRLGTDEARAACAAGTVRAVVVTAPSRAAALLDGNTPAAGTAWIAIGEPTARALRERGVVPVTAARPAPEALADAVTEALAPPGGVVRPGGGHPVPATEREPPPDPRRQNDVNDENEQESSR